MLIELTKRKEPSRQMLYMTPVIAVLLTMITGGIIFTLLGYNGAGTVWEIFIKPVINPEKWQDLGVKAAPLGMEPDQVGDCGSRHRLPAGDRTVGTV